MLKFFRFGRPAAVLATGLTLLLTPARAQMLDAAFNPPEMRASSLNAKGSSVWTLATDAADQVLVGGTFDLLNGQVRGKIGRLLASGQPDLAFGAGGVGANGAVNAIVPLPNGQYLIAGQFTHYNGVATGRVARLHASGALDISFSVGSSGPNGRVFTLGLDGRGGVLVGGAFTRWGGQPRPGLARLLPTGALDPTFTPVLASDPVVVYNLAVDAADNVLVGGRIYAPAPAPGAALLLRLLPGGATDPAFAPVLPTNLIITRVRALPGGKVLFGGMEFYTGAPTPNTLRRLNPDGTFDATFPPPFDSGFLTDLVVLPNQQLLVAGSFQFTGGSTSQDVVRLQDTGAPDLTFTSPTFGQQVSAIAPTAGGGVLIGGSFLTVGAQPLAGLAHLTSTGVLDTAFPPAVLEPYATINGLARQSGDRLVATGDFGTIGGQPQRRIVRFTATGALDPAFQLDPAVSNAHPFFASNTPTIGQNDRVLVADGRIAYRLLPDGALDPAFALGTGAAIRQSPFPPLVFGAREQPDGRLLVWGNFTSYNQVRRVNVVRLLPTGAVDPSFVPPPDSTTFIQQVNLMADGSMLLHGNGGGLRWLTASGAPLPTFNGGQRLAGAYAVGALPDTTAIISGNFILNGTLYGTLQANNVFRVRPAGVIDPGFAIDPSLDSLGGVWVVDGTLLYVGAVQGRHVLNRLRPTGAVDPSFAPVEIGCDRFDAPETFLFQSTGDLVVGGGFTTVNGTQRPTLARLTNIPTGLRADALAQSRTFDVFPNPAHTTLTLRRAAPESATATLVDVLGRPVRCWTLTAAETRLPLTGVTPGTYVVRVVGTAGVVTRRVVVE